MKNKSNEKGITSTSQTGIFIAKQCVSPWRVGKNGITLIALVITVIVLLILAGVAVSIGLDGDGLFAKANKAREDWNAKVAEEESKINAIWNTVNKKDKTDDVGIIVIHEDKEVDISKIPANKIAEYYGDYVVNYTKGGTYQLYYVDYEGRFGDVGRIYIQNTSYSRKSRRCL